MGETNRIYEKLCVPILDEIYFIQYEHRTLFSDLVKKEVCYINTDMMGFSHIKRVVDELDLKFSSVEDTEDPLFKNHKSLLSVMNPKMDQTKWLKLEVIN